MFGLDVIFIPFIIYAITLGIKNRKKFTKIMSKSIKSKRKNNFSENKNQNLDSLGSEISGNLMSSCVRVIL